MHAEPCWKRSCDGNQAWIKIARDRDKDVAAASRALFGVDFPPPGQTVALRRYAFLRAEAVRPQSDHRELAKEMEPVADLLGPGSRVRIMEYQGRDRRYVLVQVIESRNDWFSQAR